MGRRLFLHKSVETFLKRLMYVILGSLKETFQETSLRVPD